ncbi:MAG: sigma-70 family RNA polymerase sigma factor [Burkholderiaceae bacterium]
MTASDTEAQLRRLFLAGLAGDELAYRRFLQELAGHLRGFLRRRLFGWPDDVEDLVQECLLAMHTKRHTYQADQPLTPWVHAIARYKLIDLLRARGAREALHEPLSDEAPLFGAAENDALEARRDVLDMLQSLPEKQRRSIECVKIDGLSVAETARLTGQSESAVKVGIHRGLRALASRFGVGRQSERQA